MNLFDQNISYKGMGVNMKIKKDKKGTGQSESGTPLIDLGTCSF